MSTPRSEIPVSCFDWAMAVKADTTAMSEAHEISTRCVLTLRPSLRQQNEKNYSMVPHCCRVGGLSGRNCPAIDRTDAGGGLVEKNMQPTDSDGFPTPSSSRSITFEGGLSLITSAVRTAISLCPRDSRHRRPALDITVLQQPLDSIYLVATSAMDFFVSLDALDTISLSGTRADGWYLDAAREAMTDGDIGIRRQIQRPGL